jgi:hypothetical protein
MIEWQSSVLISIRSALVSDWWIRLSFTNFSSLFSSQRKKTVCCVVAVVVICSCRMIQSVCVGPALFLLIYFFEKRKLLSNIGSSGCLLVGCKLKREVTTVIWAELEVTARRRVSSEQPSVTSHTHACHIQPDARLFFKVFFNSKPKLIRYFYFSLCQ